MSALGGTGRAAPMEEVRGFDRSEAVACAISFVPKRGKALSSQTAHGHLAPRPSVFAQDDGRRTEPATTELRRMVPRVGARPNAA